MKTIDDLRLKVHELETIYKEKSTQLEQLTCKTQELKYNISLYNEALNLAKRCIEKSLDRKKYIEDIVSSGLSEVFGVPYIFVLEPVIGPDNILKGLKPKLKEENGEFEDPFLSFGAGIQAIISICLRVAILLLSPNTSRLLVLDEPLANVAPSLQEKFRKFLEFICKNTGLQVIMVTHMDEPIGKVYNVKKLKGLSSLEVEL